MKTDYTALCANVDASDPEQVKGLLDGFTGREWYFLPSRHGRYVYGIPDKDEPTVVFMNRGQTPWIFAGERYHDLPALLRALEDAGLRASPTLKESEVSCARCAELDSETVAEGRVKVMTYAEHIRANWRVSARCAVLAVFHFAHGIVPHALTAHKTWGIR